MELDICEKNVKIVTLNKEKSYGLYKTHTTTIEMMEDRGFSCTAKKENDFESFMIRYAAVDASIPIQALQFSATSKKDPNDRAMIRFDSNPSTNLAAIRGLLKYMIEEGYNIMILIGQSLTPTAKLAIKKASSKYSIQWFTAKELSVNITHHVLVPQHILVTSEEKQGLLKRYRLKEDQLPRILSNDPVARYMGLKPGQVVKVVRSSESAGRYLVYRLCVKQN